MLDGEPAPSLTVRAAAVSPCLLFSQAVLVPWTTSVGDASGMRPVFSVARLEAATSSGTKTLPAARASPRVLRTDADGSAFIITAASTPPEITLKALEPG